MKTGLFGKQFFGHDSLRSHFWGTASKGHVSRRHVPQGRATVHTAEGTRQVQGTHAHRQVSAGHTSPSGLLAVPSLALFIIDLLLSRLKATLSLLSRLKAFPTLSLFLSVRLLPSSLLLFFFPSAASPSSYTSSFFFSRKDTDVVLSPGHRGPTCGAVLPCRARTCGVFSEEHVPYRAFTFHYLFLPPPGLPS